MIQCDLCQEWFHGNGVNVSLHEAEHMDTYACPLCTPSAVPPATASAGVHRRSHSDVLRDVQRRDRTMSEQGGVNVLHRHVYYRGTWSSILSDPDNRVQKGEDIENEPVLVDGEGDTCFGGILHVDWASPNQTSNDLADSHLGIFAVPFRRSSEEEPASNPFYEIPMHWETPTPEERGKESPEQDDDIPGKQLTSSSPAVPESEVRGTFPMQVTTEGNLDEYEFETEASAYEFDEEAWQEKSQRESDQCRGSTHEPESDIKKKCRPSLRKRRARRRRELESQGMLVPQRGRGSTIETHRKAANEPSHRARPPRVNPQAEGGKVLKKEPVLNVFVFQWGVSQFEI